MTVNLISYRIRWFCTENLCWETARLAVMLFSNHVRVSGTKCHPKALWYTSPPFCVSNRIDCCALPDAELLPSDNPVRIFSLLQTTDTSHCRTHLCSQPAVPDPISRCGVGYTNMPYTRLCRHILCPWFVKLSRASIIFSWGFLWYDLFWRRHIQRLPLVCQSHLAFLVFKFVVSVE